MAFKGKWDVIGEVRREPPTTAGRKILDGVSVDVSVRDFDSLSGIGPYVQRKLPWVVGPSERSFRIGFHGVSPLASYIEFAEYCVLLRAALRAAHCRDITEERSSPTLWRVCATAPTSLAWEMAMIAREQQRERRLLAKQVRAAYEYFRPRGDKGK